MFFWKFALRALLLGQVVHGQQDSLPLFDPFASDYPDTGAANNPGPYPCPVERDPFVNLCIESSMTRFTTGYIPPDPHGAAGPNSLCAVTNVAIHCINKDGSDKPTFARTELRILFARFMTDNDPSLFDPKIVYDTHQNRFVLVLLYRNADRTVSKILVAVSRTNNPATATTADWFIHQINSAIGGNWADYPGLAVDEDAIYVTTNMYRDRAFQKSLLWVIPKTPFYTGGAPTSASYDFDVFPGAIVGKFTYMPAMVRTPAGIPNNMGTYFVSYSGRLAVCWIQNPLATAPTFGCTSVTTPNLGVNNAGAPQPETAIRIEAGDSRALQAVWVDNVLWMVTSVAQANGEGAAYWIRMTANGSNPPSLETHGPIDGENIQAGTWTYYPSFDVNSRGVAVFGFQASAATNIFASAYATIRDQNGIFRRPQLIQAGLGPYNLVDSNARNRWGDYTGTSIDPTDENCFWTFLEYAGDTSASTSNGQFGHWRTVWARVCVTPATPNNQPTRAPTLKSMKSMKSMKGMNSMKGMKSMKGRRRRTTAQNEALPMNLRNSLPTK